MWEKGLSGSTIHNAATTNFELPPIMKTFLRYGLVCVLGILVGAAVSYMFSRWERGTYAMSEYMTLVKVLAHLKNNDVSNAESMLRVSVEGNLVDVDRFGTPFLDRASPGSREAWLACYARLRRGYKPLEYHDGGAMNQRLDELLSSVDADSCPLLKR